MKRTATNSQRIVSALTSLAFLVCQLTLPQNAAAAPLGSSTASAGSVPPPSVSAIQGFQPDLFTGRATTSVGLAVPPGRRGMQPNLGLGYSSSGRNSWVGVGWSLDLGYIERNTKAGAPNYSADDYIFSFQGVMSDLVKTDAATGTYRAKDEGLFFRFVKKTTGEWEVTDKSGTRYLFGQSSTAPANSRIVNPANTSQVFRWHLDKVIDVFGNNMVVTYLKDGNLSHPDKISYTGYESPSEPHFAEVRFTLDTAARPDIDVSYRPGFELKLTKRLKSVEMWVKIGSAFQRARKYDLTYLQGTLTRRSLLSDIRQFGSDGTTGLPKTTFGYQHYAAPTYSLSTPASQANTLKLAADVNGDAISDLILFNWSTGAWSVSLGQPSGFAAATQWLPSFGGGNSNPVVGDWNNDGLADLALYSNGTWDFASSTGSAFTPYSLPTYSGYPAGTPGSGDFNGDARMDLATFNSGVWAIATASGTGFNTPVSNEIGGDCSQASSNTKEPLAGDFNGDGLTDIGCYVRNNGTVWVRLSQGTSFTPGAQWVTGLATGLGFVPEINSADIDSDGLTDVCFYNPPVGRKVSYLVSNGNGAFVNPSGAGSAAVELQIQFNSPPTDARLQMADFDGDGVIDPSLFSPSSSGAQVGYSAGNPLDTLVLVENGLGGSSEIEFKPSTQFVNTDPVTGKPTLPFVLPVVTKVTARDGRGNSYVTTYDYSGGKYDAPTREFRGFAKVTATDALGTQAITDFSQTAGTKGRPNQVEVKKNSATWTKQVNTWSIQIVATGVQFAQLDQVDGFTCDGDAVCKQTRTTFDYDQYGNITLVSEEGDTSATADDRSTSTLFVYNTAKWILGTPRQIQVFSEKDGAGTVLAQRQFFYDNATSTTTVPVKGALSKEAEWLNGTTPVWLSTSLTYDAYGNVTRIADARSNATTTYETVNTYDATSTFLTSIANAEGHQRTFDYDYLYGQVKSTTDPNLQTTTTQFDVLGRVTKVIGPATAGSPQTRYEYDACLTQAGGCTQPVKSTVHTLVTASPLKELSVYSFSDGLGRTIQTRSPAENTAKQVVSGPVEFDAKGQVIKQWPPVLADVATSYSTVSTSGLSPVTYAYDPIGRPTSAVVPDDQAAGGTVTSTTAYSDWVTTATDPNGNATKRYADAYGRLVKVDEINAGQTYTTLYTYDDRGNLVQVKDSANNTTTITYDTLGRKTAMSDPDMGSWTYTYDAVDNLLTQKDARNVVTTFTYDKINRVKTKAYSGIPAGVANPGNVTYTYDTPGTYAKGKLTKVNDGSGSTEFDYDALGRLISEEKTVGTAVYSPILRKYDLVGRMTELTYQDGEKAVYTHNDQGIGTVTLQPVSGTTQTIVSNIDYDHFGHLKKLAYGNGITTDYTYYPKSQRLNTLVTKGPGASGPTLQSFAYSYDKLGNISQITDNTYSRHQSFSYDALNRLTQAIGDYGTLTYSYDKLGNMTQKEGVTLTYPAAGSARPHAVTSTSDGWRMSYDANGNMIDKRPGACTPNYPTACSQATSLKYDAESRLVEVTHPKVSVAFVPGWNSFTLPVDPADKSVAAVFEDFAQDFEQISLYEASTGSFKHYVGDSESNQFTQLEYGRTYQVYCKNPNGVTVQFAGTFPASQAKSLSVGWHFLPVASAAAALPNASWLAGVALGQVREVKADGSTGTVTVVKPGKAYWVEVTSTSTWTAPAPASPVTKFVYDGDGGRVQQVTPAGTITFLGDLAEIDPSGALTKYIFAGDQRIAAKTPQGLRFYHGDHLGSTHVVTDTAGLVVELSENKPYGSTHRQEGLADLPHKFTGQREDSSTGLYFYNARYYDPQLGRFTQPDPYIQAPSDPQTLNRYSYVRNNPINFVDPTGHFFQFIFAAIVIIAKAAAVGAAVGAGVGAVSAAIQGENIGKGALHGAAVGATFAAGATVAAAALPFVIGPAAAAGTLGQVATLGVAGSLSGGVGSSLQGGSFGEGALIGGVVSVATFGVGRALGPVFNQIGEAVGPRLAQAGQAIASSSAGQQLQRYLAQGSDDAVYAGVRQASAFLREMGVSRDVRVKLLSTVDPRTVGIEFAGLNRYGLRYFGGPAHARGHSLFDTFPATRDSLAVKLDWNTMKFFKQWQIRPGAPIIYGRALPQGPGLSGGQMQRGVIDPVRDLLD